MIDIAEQIAGALRAAHSKGILHRDLKPGNIMLTGSGAKVLDFGLAKFTARHAKRNLPESTRGSSSETTPGMVLGTAAYMSPEQTRGENLDQQTDIWSFGCLLFEMLTRRQAFGGKTVSDCIAACLEREPKWNVLPRTTPRSLRVLLVRCLRKERESRLHDMADAQIELREARDGEPAVVSGADLAASGSFSRRLVGGVLILTAAVAVLLTLGVRGLLSPTPPPGAEPGRALSIVLPESAPLVFEHKLPYSIGRPSIALSPDGSHLVYAAGQGDSSQLYVRALDGFDATPIPDTEGGFNPFFSPDGESVGFFTGIGLHKVSLRGGRRVPLCEVQSPYGGTWNAEGTIVYAADFGSDLLGVSANGGSPRSIAARRGTLLGGDPVSNFHWPRFLPDGQTVIVSTGALDNHLEVISIRDGEILARIGVPGNRPLYVPSGHLVFGLSGDLYALPFSADPLKWTFHPVSLITGVRTSAFASGGAHQTAVANDGTIAYVPGPPLDKGTLVWSDHEGNMSPALKGERIYGAFQISPDGERLAATVTDITQQVWIFHFDGSHPPLRLTSEGQNWAPIWLTDGERVVFTSFRTNRLTLVSRRADGTGEAEELLPPGWTGGALNKPRSVSPDGKVLLFDAGGQSSSMDIWKYEFHTSRLEPFVQSPSGDSAPVFSPDGQWVALSSSRSGSTGISLCPYPAGQPVRKLTVDGGEEPMWSGDGDAIFYRNEDEWYSVSPDGGPPELLFSGPYLNAPGISYGYDVRRKRFLLVRGTGRDEPPREIRVLLNSFEKLEELAPTREP